MSRVTFIYPFNLFADFNSFDMFTNLDYSIYTNRNTFEGPLGAKARML